MRITLFRSATVLLALFFAPAPSYALKWLAWLDELSGPGPYRGWGVVADIGCIASRLRPQQDFALLVYTYAQQEKTDAAEAFERVIAAIEMADGATEEEKFRNFMATMRSQAPKPGVAVDLPSTYADLNLDKIVRSDVFLNDRFWSEYEKNQNRFSRCRVDRSNNLLSVSLELDVVKDRLKYKRDTPYEGKTDLVAMAVVGYVPIGRIGQLASLVRGRKHRWGHNVPAWGRTIEIGVGAGAYGLTGSTLTNRDMWRGIVPLRVRALPVELVWQLVASHKNKNRTTGGLDTSLPPEDKASRLRRAAQAFEYRFGQDLVIGTIDARLYGDNGPRTTDDQNEWIKSHAVTVNLGMVYRAAFGR